MMFLWLATAVTVYGYLCRMDKIHVLRHRPGVVLVHVLGAIVSVLACGYSMLGTDTGLSAVVYLGWAVAALWLIYTLPLYRKGPPAGSERPGLVPLDSRHHGDVWGGKK